MNHPALAVDATANHSLNRIARRRPVGQGKGIGMGSRLIEPVNVPSSP